MSLVKGSTVQGCCEYSVTYGRAKSLDPCLALGWHSTMRALQTRIVGVWRPVHQNKRGRGKKALQLIAES